MCQFCARYGGTAPQSAPQSWQPPQWTPAAYQAQPQYAQPPTPAAYGYPVDTGINLLELDWARTRVMWAWLLIGVIGALSIGAYWIITRHPDVVVGMIFGFLMDPAKASQSSEQTKLDILQLIVYFILSWLPLTGWAVHYLTSPPNGVMGVLAQAADISPLMWQGMFYLLLAVLIWRRSMIALLAAALLFLADSGIYVYGIFKLFQQLSDLNAKFVSDMQAHPSLLVNNPYDPQHWPWGLVVPIVVRGALVWLLLMSFSAMGVVRLHHRRLKAAKTQTQTLAA